MGKKMEYAEITIDEVTKIIKASHNWKALGHDRLQNFWWKEFTIVHHLLAKQFTNNSKSECNTAILNKRNYILNTKRTI
jgi:hypothetical protein